MTSLCVRTPIPLQTAVRFAKGHRIRLHVASAGFIRWERNIMGYGYPSLIPVAFEVMHGPGNDGAEASSLRLPVLELDLPAGGKK